VVNSFSDADLELSFASELVYLDLVQSVAEGISRLAGFDSDSQYWISLSVREAVTNAVQHGNKGDKEKKVQLRFKLDSDRLLIGVKDQGEGIEEANIPDPLDPENLLKPGGRGIFFVRSFMDSMRFFVWPEGGHELIMEKLRMQKNQGEENDN
jgi:serine/threonine-protein kinase RsbW